LDPSGHDETDDVIDKLVGLHIKQRTEESGGYYPIFDPRAIEEKKDYLQAEYGDLWNKGAKDIEMICTAAAELEWICTSDADLHHHYDLWRQRVTDLQDNIRIGENPLHLFKSLRQRVVHSIKHARNLTTEMGRPIEGSQRSRRRPTLPPLNPPLLQRVIQRLEMRGNSGVADTPI